VAAAQPAAAVRPAAAPAKSEGSTASGANRWGITDAEEVAWKEVEAAALKEGKLNYHSIGSIPPSTNDLLKSEFAKDYPGISIEVLNVGSGGQLTSRITIEQDAKAYVADVADNSSRAALVLIPRASSRSSSRPRRRCPQQLEESTGDALLR
jgi:hypothetical protein